MDEYDTPLNNALFNFSEQEQDKVFNLIREIFSSTFKGSGHVEKVLVTGILRIAQLGLFSGANNFTDSGIYEDLYANFYGFTQEEVDKLCFEYILPNHLKSEIKNWYNGYKVGNFKIYNPWSVMKSIQSYVRKINNSLLVKEKIIQNYWAESGHFNKLDKLFEIPIIKKNIEALCRGESIKITFKKELGIEEFKFLENISTKVSWTYNPDILNIAFSLFYFAGYLTDAGTSENKNNSKS